MTFTEAERIRELEVRVDVLTRKIEKMDDTVTELRDLLVASRGARWFFGAMVAIGSIAGGTVLQKIIPTFFGK